MTEYFKPKVRFTSNDKIFQFTVGGKLESTTQYMAPKCPQCGRYEHHFDLDSITVWCCANDSCIEQRVFNAGVSARTWPINFLSHVKKRNNFATAKLEMTDDNSDFIEKWTQLKEGKIKDIIVLGMMGAGKTYCMYGALREVCKDGEHFSTMFLTETELYEKIKNTWDRESLCSEQEMLKKISSPDFLFIDDLGSATRTNQGEWGKQILLDVLDERLNNLTLRTIISTNLFSEQIGTVYDQRIADRIKFMKVCCIKGESKRKPFETPEEKTEQERQEKLLEFARIELDKNRKGP